MKNNILIVIISLLSIQAFAQNKSNASAHTITNNTQIHRIVFQLSTDDTLAHKALMKQLNNITSVAPDTKIEVVCHGPGLSILMKDKTMVLEKIQQLHKKGIEFVACEFSMSERNVPKEKLISEAGYVKAGIIEIVSKQEEGWSYIKAGF